MLSTIIFYILRGFVVTLSVTAIAVAVGLSLGVFFATLYVYGGQILSRLMAIYSVLFRGVPPIVLLFLLYFLMAQNIDLSPFWAGSLALGIISSSYQMEIFRGAILSVKKGQMVAARSIGMSRLQAIRYVILPQALRIAIPPWSNEASILLKDSSLVLVIGVPEMLRRAQHVSARTYQPLLAYSIAAAIYFLMTYGVNRFLDVVERKTSIPSI